MLAGDANQLDAVTKSRHAVALNFNVSFMEQLLKKQLYKRKSNHNFITQLTKNYRCHPAILTKPSELFYDNVLEAEASEGKYQNFVSINVNILLSINIIII